MPDLDLGDIARIDLSRPILPATPAAVLEAGCRLFAFMAWPTDDPRRRQFLARVVADAIAAVESLEPGPAPLGTLDQFFQAIATMKQFLLDEYLLPLGGFRLLADSPGKHVLSETTANLSRGWYVAAMILIYVRAMADDPGAARGGASVRKAIDLVERFSKANRKQAKAGWREYKSVAHLCAAQRVLNIMAGAGKLPREVLSEDGEISIFHGLGLILSVARDFQTFAFGYRPHGQSRPILSPDETWNVPEALRLPLLPWQGIELPKDVRDALAEYRRAPPASGGRLDGVLPSGPPCNAPRAVDM